MRFAPTAKLKIATPSQLFKQLNPYFKQHPIYQAPKEFGHVIRTIFILEYIYDLVAWKAIQSQKIE